MPERELDEWGLPHVYIHRQMSDEAIDAAVDELAGSMRELVPYYQDQIWQWHKDITGAPRLRLSRDLAARHEVADQYGQYDPAFDNPYNPPPKATTLSDLSAQQDLIFNPLTGKNEVDRQPGVDYFETDVYRQAAARNEWANLVTMDPEMQSFFPEFAGGEPVVAPSPQARPFSAGRWGPEMREGMARGMEGYRSDAAQKLLKKKWGAVE